MSSPVLPCPPGIDLIDPLLLEGTATWVCYFFSTCFKNHHGLARYERTTFHLQHGDLGALRRACDFLRRRRVTLAREPLDWKGVAFQRALDVVQVLSAVQPDEALRNVFWKDRLWDVLHYRRVVQNIKPGDLWGQDLNKPSYLRYEVLGSEAVKATVPVYLKFLIDYAIDLPPDTDALAGNALAVKLKEILAPLADLRW